MKVIITRDIWGVAVWPAEKPPVWSNMAADGQTDSGQWMARGFNLTTETGQLISRRECAKWLPEVGIGLGVGKSAEGELTVGVGGAQ